MEHLRATDPLHLRGVVLITVQRVRVQPSRGWGSVHLHACAEPRAIVIRHRGAWHAVDPGGARIALEPLLEEAEGLAQAMAAEEEG